MSQFKLAVFLNAKEGKETEFNEWYNHHHVPDALSMPAFKTGQRFKAGPRYMDRDAPCKYMALYDIEAENMEAALQIASDGTAKFFISDAVDLASAYAIPLTPLTPIYHSSAEAKANADAMSVPAT